MSIIISLNVMYFKKQYCGNIWFIYIYILLHTLKRVVPGYWVGIYEIFNSENIPEVLQVFPY